MTPEKPPLEHGTRMGTATGNVCLFVPMSFPCSSCKLLILNWRPQPRSFEPCRSATHLPAALPLGNVERAMSAMRIRRGSLVSDGDTLARGSRHSHGDAHDDRPGAEMQEAADHGKSRW